MPEDRSKANEDEIFEFDCPECGRHIVGETDKCPGCGTEFVIEEVPMIECPSCGVVCSLESETCSSCGKGLVDEGEDEMRLEFPRLVAEVKPLLMLSKDYEVEVGEGRRLIDRAVQAGKQRDLATAVQMVKEARSSIKAALDERLVMEEGNLEKLVTIVSRSGIDPKEVSESLTSLRNLREQGDIEGALQAAAKGRKAAERSSGKYLEANDLVESLSRLIDVCDQFYLDVREAKRMLHEARDAGNHGDWGMMGILARKGREQLMRALPEATKGEMRKAKNQLLDAKAEGKDVRTLVKVLKDAGVAMNRERHDLALEGLLDFKDELKRL
ncbi:MAG TPA: zinc ribbon domain-containing protein [Methanomassiliicoccales archaeon]|nr:zinc ribbon domain-containing protein [Methanomassiliicoccales archaeon]HPR98621.1 zinc ribbon domain-containing protein [Methanomassiliicoccales archaeon]